MTAGSSGTQAKRYHRCQQDASVGAGEEIPRREEPIDEEAVKQYVRDNYTWVLSWGERQLLNAHSSMGESEKRTSLIVGSLRKKYFSDCQKNPFLKGLSLTTKILQASENRAKQIIAEHIYSETTELGWDSYWIRSAAKCKGTPDDPVTTLCMLYPSWFQRDHDLLLYVLDFDDPLLFIEILREAVESYIKNNPPNRKSDMAYYRLRRTASVGLVRALWLEENTEDKPNRVSGLLPEIAIHFLKPVFDE